MVRTGSRMRSARMLAHAELGAALELCAQAPVDSVLAASRIVTAQATPDSPTQVWGFPASGPFRAVCWVGANVVPVIPDPADREDALDAFSAVMLASGRMASSIVGEQGLALGLWARIEPLWPSPREIRREQPSMAISSPSALAPDPEVRRTGASEFDDLLPACVAMFIEEVGYSPIVGSGTGYGYRVRSLIDSGRSYIRNRPGEGITFKAEVGALGPGVAQIQGVWIPPSHRGRGLAPAAMAGVVNAVLAEHAPLVTLYVNSFNKPALATYWAVGFEQVGTYTTILF